MNAPSMGLVVPGGPLPRTGGTLYNRALAQALERKGTPVLEVALPGTWPLPSHTERATLQPQLAALPHGLPLVVDGLVWTGLGALLPSLVARHPCTVLVHSPLFREVPAGSDRARVLQSAEAAALARAHQRIATGGPTLRDLTEVFGLTGTCVPPGTDRQSPVPALHPTAMVSVATVTPRKGHDRLLEALAPLQSLPWHLTCAGATHLAPSWKAHIDARVRALGLQNRVTFRGELGPAALDQLWMHAGLMVHGAHFEAWGMALSEAVARGIPVVSTPAGALEGHAAKAARILPAGGPSHTWTAALQDVMTRGHATLRRHARAVVQPDWDETATALTERIAR